MANPYIFKDRSKIRFETDEEKMIHRIVSGLKWGEAYELIIDGTNPDDKARIVKTIKKSAAYNNMDVKIKWAKDFKSINIIHEM